MSSASSVPSHLAVLLSSSSPDAPPASLSAAAASAHALSTYLDGSAGGASRHAGALRAHAPAIARLLLRAVASAEDAGTPPCAPAWAALGAFAELSRHVCGGRACLARRHSGAHLLALCAAVRVLLASGPWAAGEPPDPEAEARCRPLRAVLQVVLGALASVARALRRRRVSEGLDAWCQGPTWGASAWVGGDGGGSGSDSGGSEGSDSGGEGEEEGEEEERPPGALRRHVGGEGAFMGARCASWQRARQCAARRGLGRSCEALGSGAWGFEVQATRACGKRREVWAGPTKQIRATSFSPRT